MDANYHFTGESQFFSPSLIYYKDLLLKNTEMAISVAGSAARLWPHVKTHKTREFTQLQTEMGIKCFKCATIAEAEMVAETDAERILLAYPLIGPNIDRYIRLSLAYPEKTFFALGDNLETIRMLGAACVKQGTQMRCFIDVNAGMNRTGVSFKDILPFYEAVSAISGILPEGLHCYDGDRHEKDYEERMQRVRLTIKKVQEVRYKLKKRNMPCPYVIMGGSPTFPCYARETDDVYFSPGTVFVYDEGYRQQFPDLPYIPGAAILTRVISHPADGYFTLDTGYKAISSEQGVRGKLLECPDAEEVFQSEEHWTFRMKAGAIGERPPIGKILYIIPWHICPTTALYEKIHVVSGGSLRETWETKSRNRSINY